MNYRELIYQVHTRIGGAINEMLKEIDNADMRRRLRDCVAQELDDAINQTETRRIDWAKFYIKGGF